MNQNEQSDVGGNVGSRGNRERKKWLKRISALTLFAMFFSAAPEYAKYGESLLWKVISVLPDEVSTPAFIHLVQLVLRPELDVEAKSTIFDPALAKYAEPVFTKEKSDRLEVLFNQQNPEYQSIQTILTNAYSFAESYGALPKDQIYWEQNPDFITVAELASTGFTIPEDRSGEQIYSEELRDLRSLSADGFTYAQTVAEITNIIHGSTLNATTVKAYYGDYLNFVVEQYVATGDRVDLGNLIGYAIVRNKGSLNKAIWDAAIFCKVLTRNSLLTFRFSGYSPVSGINIYHLLKEPFPSKYSVAELVSLLGDENLKFWNFEPTQGNKNFDPANMTGVTYHILFLLALGDRIDLSLIPGGVIDELDNFAAAGEYGDEKVKNQINYLLNALGFYGEKIIEASKNTPKSETTSQHAVYVANFTEFEKLVSSANIQEGLEAALQQGTVFKLETSGKVFYARLFGSVFVPYAVISEALDALKNPLTAQDLAASSAFQTDQSVVVTTMDMSEIDFVVHPVLPIEAFPQHVIFSTILDACSEGLCDQLPANLADYVFQHSDEFITFASNIGWERLSPEMLVGVFRLLNTSLAQDLKQDLLTRFPRFFVERYEDVADLMSKEELYGYFARQYTSVDELYNYIVVNPDFFISLFEQLHSDSSNLPFANQYFQNGLLAYNNGQIFDQYFAWRDVLNPQDVVAYLETAQNYDPIYANLEFLMPVISHRLFESLVTKDPKQVLVNLHRLDLSKVYPGEIFTQTALLADLQRLLPDEYTYFVATNLMYFEQLLYVEELGVTVQTSLLQEVVQQQPVDFFRNLGTYALPGLEALFTFEYVQSLFPEEIFQDLMINAPQYFADNVSDAGLLQLVLSNPEAFLDNYYSGWDKKVSSQELKGILMNSDKAFVILMHPNFFQLRVTKDELVGLLNTQAALNMFVGNYINGWNFVVPKDELLSVLKQSGKYEDVSWVESVLGYPNLFAEDFPNDGFIQDLVMADGEAVAKYYKMGYLDYFLTDEQQQALENLLTTHGYPFRP